MKFTNFLTVVLLANGVAADLVNRAICTLRDVDFVHDMVNDLNTTTIACNRYKERNTGDKQWDQCPDCIMDSNGVSDYCHSPGEHIGVKEWGQYCTEAGSDSWYTQGK
ncbi:hypothetical protein HYFRA_00009638 [Hymenoscyphus fraxineus]|uniref:Uncharacterized protein n=1 Tax=Hymenoscyphus fraxineus TaxID=746836 RepID=A0A9N9PH28_9HELO|nr:hypothetical protein HYFRA_00009638 [Hymenoscyphus fraxineus]